MECGERNKKKKETQRNLPLLRRNNFYNPRFHPIFVHIFDESGKVTELIHCLLGKRKKKSFISFRGGKYRGRDMEENDWTMANL